MGTDADRREEARREEIDERLERRGVECEDCGHRWVPGRACCPVCGGAIGDPDPVLVEVLAMGPCSAHEIAVNIDLPDGVVRRRLKRLEAAGLVESEDYQRGARVYLPAQKGGA